MPSRYNFVNRTDPYVALPSYSHNEIIGLINKKNKDKNEKKGMFS